MKSRLICVLLAVFVACFAFVSCASTEPLPEVEPLPFTKGVNMLTYFETWTKGELPSLSKHNEKNFACLKNMGVNVIRLPIHFENLMEPYATGEIYDVILEKLDQVCDWAEKYQIYLVIDNHSFNSEEEDNNPPTAQFYKEHLEAVWPQLAQRYKNRSKYIIYEIINEPASKGDIAQKWVKIQQEIIDLIRTYDPYRDIVVTSAEFSSIDTLVKMKPYNDPNLIYTFHFYEPMIFTHQGATWVGEGMANVKDMPFPYDRSRMPKLNKTAASDGWVQYEYGDYNKIGTEKYINSRIKKAATWAKKNNVRLWCGEMGAKIWINPQDRLAWINATRTALLENDIPYCCWGLDGTDGFLKSDDDSMIFPYDIDKEAVKAYGFAMPDEKFMAKTNDFNLAQKPLIIYDNGISEIKLKIHMWGNTHVAIDADTHKLRMKASYTSQWGSCDFSIDKNIASQLAEYEKELSICFSVKFTNVNQSFLIDFRDKDEGSALLPWSRAFRVEASDYPIGKWIEIEIPFSNITETGAWSNTEQKFYEPQNKFDWNRLEVLSLNFNDNDNEYTGDVYLDNIVIKMK